MPVLILLSSVSRDSLLESLEQLQQQQQLGGNGHSGSSTSALLSAVGERFQLLKASLDVAVTERPPSCMSGFSEYMSNVWRCRALLFNLAGSESGIDPAGENK